MEDIEEFDSIVYDAAGSDDIELLKEVLASHGHLIDVPNPHEENATPMHNAALYNRVEAIELLVQHGSTSTQARDHLGMCPLHTALMEPDSAEAAQALLRLDAQAIEIIADSGVTTMHAAATGGHVELIEKLFHLGCSIDVCDDFDDTPMDNAVQDGHVSAVETFIRLGNKDIDTIDECGYSLIHDAAREGHATMVEALVRMGSKHIDTRNLFGDTPMHVAAGEGHVSVIEALVRLGSTSIDAGRKNQPPPRKSTYGSDVFVVDIFGRFGGFDSSIGGPVLGFTPMHMAAKRGHAHVLEALVRLGSKAIDSRDLSGLTPMHIAAENDRTAAIETIARLGSNSLDILGAHFDTPFFVAYNARSKAAARTLVLLGADPGEPHGLFSEVRKWLKAMKTSNDEDEAVELRYRVYFRDSLVHRLLFQLDKAENQ